MNVRHPRRAVAAGAALLLGATGLTAASVVPAQAAVSCEVEFAANPWMSQPGGGGFTAYLSILNTGDPLDGWTLEFDLPTGHGFTQGWSAEWSVEDQSVTASSLSWNQTIGTGATVDVGFNGTWTGAFAEPASFSVNGVECGSDPGQNQPPEVSVTGPSAGQQFEVGTDVSLAADASDDSGVDRVEFLVDGALAGSDSSAPYTATASGLGTGSHSVVAVAYDDGAPQLSTESSPVSFSVTSGEVPPRVDNPYSGADVYVNPDWASTVLDEAADAGGALGDAMEQVATNPTFVWLDRIAAITEGTGLAGHLDNAVALDAANGGTPTVFQVVIYDLPNRDCAASASNGELRIDENGFEIYREQFIDPIVDVLSDPAYADLRISAVLEVDSLPNLVTNLDIPECAEANGPGGYRDGIRYALNELESVPNVYSYLDIAHSGWLGWDSNFGPAVDLYIDTLTSTAHYGPAPGLDSIAGFVTNSANYTPTVEPFLPDSSATPPGGGNPIRSADFYEWNPYFDEMTFAQALHGAFTNRGIDGFGMLIDTSRNGWGGLDRPTQVSDSTDLNTYVDESRVDSRPHRGGWCNQDGAGIGERPVANPAESIDAFVWVKPPGESDGVADPDAPPDPDDPAKQHDVMCDPDAQNSYDPSKPTNALPGAPHAGRWFPAQFAMLVENAYPPLD